MGRLILSSACILVTSAGAAPAVATQAAAAAAVNQVASASSATCDAKYYNYLVGKGLDEARAVDGTNYRVLPSTGVRGETNPKRMTIVFDPRSNQITEVACG